MSAPLSAADLFPAPHWFPHAADPIQDLVLLVQRTEAELKAASFLDDRSLTAASQRKLVAWQSLAAAAPPAARRDLQFIFHIGHVGSTLLARLLGEIPSILSLREPLILRSLYEADRLAGRPEAPWDPASFATRVDLVGALLSRTFGETQRVIVKATSFTSEIAAQLVPSGSAALFMHVSPLSYLENILAGDASRQELHQLAGSRLARLETRLSEAPSRLWELSEGKRAALAWACEMTSVAAAAKRLPKVRWCDFDHFLAQPAAELADISDHFGHPIGLETAARLCAGPIMSRYSKAPEHQYSPGLRTQVLAQSRAQNGAAIREGMDWLMALGSRYKAIGEVLEQAG